MFSLSLSRRSLAGMLVGAALAALPMSMAQAADITVSHPWARASAMVAKAGAGFLTIQNTGASDDTLLSAQAPTSVSAVTELHTHIKEGDVMKMRKVDSIPVPAGQTVTLQPGGLHVMLIDLAHPLTEGESFPLTLTFEKAGTVEVTMSVKGMGTMAPEMHQGHDAGDHHPMSK